MNSLAPQTIDRVGIVASTICLIHCLATPLVIALLPFAASDGFESWTLVILLTMASISAGFAAWRHDFAPVIPYVIGALLLAVGHALLEIAWVEHLTTSLGAIALLLTHLLSLRRERVTSSENAL